MEELPTRVGRSDVVTTATNASDYLLTFKTVSSALAERRGRPLSLFDLSVPRNIDPNAASEPGVSPFNIDGLSAMTRAIVNKLLHDHTIALKSDCN